MTEWISVKDRLPEENGRYLVYSSHKGIINASANSYPYPVNKVNIAYFSAYNSEWKWSSFSDVECNPTFFAKIPNPPKEGSE